MHNTSASSNKVRLIVAIVINSAMVIFELIFGFMVGSLALISDAFHNLSDVGAMSLSLMGERVIAKPSNKRKTYGYKKADPIIAFVNSSALIVIISIILFESVKRIFVPAELSGSNMMMVAGVAFAGNTIASTILHKSSKTSLNIKSAWLHSFQDALFSLAVIISGAFIYYFNWYLLDPLISIVIALALIREAYKIIKESVNLLMDSVPSDIDFEKVKEEILSVKNVVEISDLHIWQCNKEDRFISMHVITGNIREGEKEATLFKIKKTVAKKFNLIHSTIQIVSEKEAKKLEKFSVHCN